MNNDVNEIVAYLNESMHDPFPRYILITEIEGQPADNAMLSSIRESKWYRQLETEQLEDGSWGRFHSMDPSITTKKKFRTTEEALRRAKELALTKDDPVIEKSLQLLERYLKGEDTWNDRVEKHHDNGRSFCHSRQYITAANLCRFDTNHPLIKKPREVCAKQLEEAFSDGSYNDVVWRNANLDYTGTCLDAFMVYPLWLLQGTDSISDELQRKYLRYIRNRKEGIYYISGFQITEKKYSEDKYFTMWLRALEVVSGFSLSEEIIDEPIIEHLKNEAARLITDEVILPAAHPVTGHYSESWRNYNTRKNDLILRIVRILRRKIS